MTQQRKNLIGLLAFLAIALCALFCRAEIRFVDGTTGSTYYARIKTGASTYVAVALSEGSTSALRNYVATDAQILTAAGGTLAASSDTGYPITIREGTPSTTADDAVVGVSSIIWTGTVEGTPPANITQFGGTAGTFSGGRAEVNSTHWAGTAVGSANVRANVTQFGGIALPTGLSTSESGAVETVTGLVAAEDAQLAGGTVLFYDVSDTQARQIRTIISNTDTTLTLDSGGILSNSQFVIIPASPISAKALKGLSNPATSGGLPTVNSSNQVAGVSGSVVGSVGSVTGAVGSVTSAVNVGSLAGNAISGAKIAGNFQTFFQNGAGDTSAIVDDVGTGGGATAAEVWAYSDRSLSDGSIKYATFDPTSIADADSLSVLISDNTAVALAAIGLDQLVAAPATSITDNSVIAKLVSKSSTASWSSFVNTTDSMEAQRDNLGTAGAGMSAVPYNSAWSQSISNALLMAPVGSAATNSSYDRLNEILKAARSH